MLSTFGYDGIFVPKRCSPCTKFGYYSDGCALFWKTKLFELVYEERRQFNKMGQVFIIATLRHIPSQRLITVAVTHLKAKKGQVNERVRTDQIIQLLQDTAQHSEHVSLLQNYSQNIPIIIMGDFNAEVEGKDVTCIPTVLNGGYLSVYNTQQNESFTTYKSRGKNTVKRTIDYIFYRKSMPIKCLQTLNLPKDGNVFDSWGLPGFSYPSDHIMIGAKFKFL